MRDGGGVSLLLHTVLIIITTSVVSSLTPNDALRRGVYREMISPEPDALRFLKTGVQTTRAPMVDSKSPTSYDDMNCCEKYETFGNPLLQGLRTDEAYVKEETNALQSIRSKTDAESKSARTWHEKNKAWREGLADKIRIAKETNEQECCKVMLLASIKLIQERSEEEIAKTEIKQMLPDVERNVKTRELSDDGAEAVYQAIAGVMSVDTKELKRMMERSADADAAIVRERIENTDDFVEKAKTYLADQKKMLESQIVSMEAQIRSIDKYLDNQGKVTRELAEGLKRQYDAEEASAVKLKLPNTRPTTHFVESAKQTVEFFTGPFTKEEMRAHYPHKFETGDRIRHSGVGWSDGTVRAQNADGTYEVVHTAVAEAEIQGCVPNDVSDGGEADRTKCAETSNDRSQCISVVDDAGKKICAFVGGGDAEDVDIAHSTTTASPVVPLPTTTCAEAIDSLGCTLNDAYSDLECESLGCEDEREDCCEEDAPTTTTTEGRYR